jgi:SsrA-binding protein
MARPHPIEFEKTKVVAENRRARFEYFLEEFFEAGIALTGTEVKSLRFGEGTIAEAYAEIKNGEVNLINANIPRQIEKMMKAIGREGMTLIPMSVYFNGRGRAKVELALAKGKKVHDKRDTVKARDWKRDQQRLLRDRG